MNQSQAGHSDQPDKPDDVAGGYASMTSKEKKDGKNVYVDDSGKTINRPSLLNFDITGDVTKDISDNEANS